MQNIGMVGPVSGVEWWCFHKTVAASFTVGRTSHRDCRSLDIMEPFGKLLQAFRVERLNLKKCILWNRISFGSTTLHAALHCQCRAYGRRLKISWMRPLRFSPSRGVSMEACVLGSGQKLSPRLASGHVLVWTASQPHGLISPLGV